MTPTDLKPGDVVQHSEHGYGIFYVAAAGSLVMHRNAKGHVAIDDLDEEWESAETCTWRERQWLDYRGGVQCTCDTYPETTSGPEEDCEIHGRPYEEWVKRAAEAEAELARAEIVRPGHVQVRVDDLDLGTDVHHTEDDFVTSVGLEWPEYREDDRRLIYRAIAAQRAESTPPADETPSNDEKPTSATVTLFCPVEGCGEPVEVGVHLWALKNIRDCYVTSECGGHRCKPAQPDEHTCKPLQPDEPTEFGARVTVTRPNGTREKWCCQYDGYCWADENGLLRSWDELTQRGTVTLGWDA